MENIFIGMAGWSYPPWRGNFYPKGTKVKDELIYASQQVNSIEINGTFYRMQKPETFQKWHDSVPDDFVFSVKSSQFITHKLRLKNAEKALCNFLASGLLCLKAKLGPILWQFPPFVMLKDSRFEEFFQLLPKTSKEAQKLAKNHDHFVAGRTWTQVTEDFPIYHACEFRHPSFKANDFCELMQKNKIAYVFADSGKHSLDIEYETAEFVYLRLHGEGKDYKQGYSDKHLKKLATKIVSWHNKNLKVFAYFDNAAKDYAPQNATKLTTLVEEELKKQNIQEAS